MNSFADLWGFVLEEMNKTLTPSAINIWVKPMVPLNLENDVASFFVPSAFQKNMIMSKYLPDIKQALENVLGFEVAVEVSCEEDKPKEPVREDVPAAEPAPAAEEPETRSIDQQFTFDNYVVGSNNRLAYAASFAVAKTPFNSYNPLFLYGNSGLGKTHLLYAIGNEIRRQFPNYKVVYLRGEDFTNELIEAIGSGSRVQNTTEFRNKYRHVDVLLVDDIQFIGGKPGTQEEFFHTFNSLYEANKLIVLSSDRPPKEIETLEERLRTRFESDMICDIQPPDFETRVAIVRRKADSINISLPDDVVDYLANHLKSNIRQLEGAVKRMKARHLLESSPIDLDLAIQTIKDITVDSAPVTTTVEKIIEDTARFFNLTAEDLKGNKRTAEVARARQVAMYVVREVTEMSLPFIGKTFGGRDHSTVLHSIRKVEQDLKVNSKLKNSVNDLIKNLRSE